MNAFGDPRRPHRFRPSGQRSIRQSSKGETPTLDDFRARRPTVGTRPLAPVEAKALDSPPFAIGPRPERASAVRRVRRSHPRRSGHERRRSQTLAWHGKQEGPTARLPARAPGAPWLPSDPLGLLRMCCAPRYGIVAAWRLPASAHPSAPRQVLRRPRWTCAGCPWVLVDISSDSTVACSRRRRRGLSGDRRATCTTRRSKSVSERHDS